jgi:two-component system, LytTR family, sensor kinase
MNPGQTLLRLRLHHLIIWAVVALTWYYLRYQDYRTSNIAWQVTVVKTIDLALMVYTCNYLLIPKLLYKKRYLFFILSFIVMVVSSSIYKMTLIGKLTGNGFLLNWPNNLKARVYDNIIPHFFLVIAGVAIKLLFDYISMQKKLIEVAKEKAETELSFLKSQINPHFLFNSLNAVYFLIDRNNSEAREALHKFSEMLRYQLYELKGEKIQIEKEVGYLRDYIALQKLRMENCEVDLKIEEQMDSFYIEPLLLVPFVENAFKHISHYYNGRKNEIRIGLSRQNGEMFFVVDNTTEGKQPEVHQQGGIGLKNVKRRLELLYPRKHRLVFGENDGWYHVGLNLKIDDNGSN